MSGVNVHQTRVEAQVKSDANAVLGDGHFWLMYVRDLHLAVMVRQVGEAKTPRLPNLRIPVNVTADSGNVTDSPAGVTEGRCCAV